jgi:hypothetical protein
MKEFTEMVFNLIENRDKQSLLRLLDQNPSIPITDIIDNRGYTLMHMVCFKNIEDIGLSLMDKAK